MKLFKITMILMVTAVMAFGVACSEDDKFPIFQNNNGSTAPGGADYDPFGFLPNNPGTTPSESFLSTILDAFDPTGGLSALMLLDPTAYEQFVDRLSLIIDEADANNKRDEVYYTLSLVDVLANDLTIGQKGHGAYGLMESLKNIMSYVIGQDALDEVPYGGTGVSYIDDLYVFMDKVRGEDLDLKSDIFELLFKMLDYTYWEYVDDTSGPPQIQDIMTDLRAFLSDTTDPNLTWLVYNLQEALGKIMMRANSNIYFDDPLDWDQAGSTAIDIKLGNSVDGMDYLLQAVTDMISPNNTTDGADVRGDIYGILEQSGKLVSALKGDVGDPYYPFSDLKCLLMNIEDYFTVGGAVYGSSTDYNDPVGGTPSSYVNAELRNGVKELWPGLAKLFIRERAGGASDPDYSIVYSGNHQRSPVEWLTRAMYKLKKAGIDYSDEANYAIEPSLKQAVQYNAYGQERSGSVLNMSMLDHMMLTIAGGYTFGYKTRTLLGQDADNEPYHNAPCEGNGGTSSYIHGMPTNGILTMNDTMYSVRNTGLNTVATATWCINVLDTWSDSYNLALAKRTAQGPYNWRSSDPFDYDDDKTNLRFYIGYDYPALCLLPASAAGDVGIPQGGRTAIVPTTDTTGDDGTNNDYRTFFPKVADGVGDLNTGTWIFSWIARACWDGAGPYYTTDDALTGVTNSTLQNPENCPTCPDWPGKGTAQYDVVFKPNGEVYAYIDRSGDPYLYYYPVSGNDVVDPDASANSQRSNRYRDVCRSDYYMVQNGHTHGSSMNLDLGFLGHALSLANPTAYCVPPMNPAGSAFAEGTTGGNKYKLQPGNHDAQYFQTYETVVEWDNDDSPNPDDPSYPYRGNTNRECATQEEAMYRNYQWLMLEKKFMFVIPLNLFAQWSLSIGGNAWLDSAAFIIIESNGVVGSTNAARGTANGRWLQLGDEGVGADANSPADHRNYPDYGNSLRPGDARIMAFAYEYIALDHMETTGVINGMVDIDNGTVDPTVVFNLLGGGHVMPDIVGSNIAPVARLGFVTPATIPSSRFDIGSADWTNRNKLLPIFAALAGVMKDGTRYVAGSDNNYNYAGHHKYPLHELMENVLVPLSKPHMRVFNGGSTYGIRWVPRMYNESIEDWDENAYPSGSNPNFAYFMPNDTVEFSSDQIPDYRPRADLRTLVSFMADSNTATYADGLIPALADSNNRLVTRLLSLLQRLGNNETGSVYKDVAGGGLGILENFSKGLEQIFTSIQLSEGDLTANGYGYLNDSRYHWMYKSNGDRTTGTPTPISVDLDVALNQLIGNNTDAAGYGGISTFVDRHGPQGAGGPVPTGDWANYDRLLDALVALIGEPGTGAYDIMGNTDASTPGSVIRIMDKLLGSVSTDENDVKALRHTLGVLMARYQGGNWEPSTSAESELYTMLNHLLPETLGVFDTHYGDFVVAFKSLLDYDLDGTMDPEALEYLIDLLVPGDNAEEIVNNMYNLLNRDAMFDPAYWGAGGYDNHATLIELAEICQDILYINHIEEP